MPRRFRHGLLVVGAFSLAFNLLQLVLPLYSMQVFDRVLASGSRPTLLALSVIAATFVVSGVLLDALRAGMLVRLGTILELQWREPLLASAFHPGGQPAITASFRDLEVLKGCVTGPGLAALLDLPWCSLFVIAVFALDPLLGWLSVAAIALLLAVAVAGEAFSGRWGREAQARMGEAQRLLEVSLAGRDAVLSMGAEAPIRQRISALRDHAALSGARSLDRLAWSAAAARGLRNLLQVVVLMTAAFLVLSEQVPAGVIVASSMLFARALAPIERVSAGYRQLRAAREALLRLTSLTTVAGNGRGQPLSLPNLTGRIDVEDLTARRSPTAAVAVASISFKLEAGEVLALVGTSGSGKSTLARSLVGLTTPTGGTVRLDGASVVDWDSGQLGRQVGFLPQEPVLLEGTIAEVIARFGPIDDAKVIAAAKRAGAHELFLRLPDGYQTVVGRSDHQLSVGERQRVALARAFYGDPALLVLDEPGTYLDEPGELNLLAAVKAAKHRGATIVVVSRAANLLAFADRMLMLEKGRLALFQPMKDVRKYLTTQLVPARSDSASQVKQVIPG